MSRILVIEDEEIIRTALKRLLQRYDHLVDEAGSVDEALDQFELQDYDLVIADLRLPGSPGTHVIDKCPGIPVLIMTSYASVPSAVESMKLGAVDYIAKPFDHDEMVMVVSRIIKQRLLERKAAALESDFQREYPILGIVGESSKMLAVFDRVHKVAPTDTTVLIRGESGTGKELVARAIHQQSERKDSPIVAVNCAAIPESLIESELFGHAKGAFTGATESRTGLIESADGGTLFLDEIAELSLPAQARLLRFLQDGEVRGIGSDKTHIVDVRLIAATHRDLEGRVSDELFRDDLYYRLKVMEIELPPLRERESDIDILADYLLDKLCKRLKRSVAGFHQRTRRQMHQYDWPGNVREMENTVERAVILSDGGLITPELFALETVQRQSPKRESQVAREDKTSLDDYTKHFVLEHQGMMTETEIARRLGISRKTLWEKRQKFGIPRTRSV